MFSKLQQKTGQGVQEIFNCLINKLFNNKNIGKVLPSEDDDAKRRGSHVLNKKTLKPKDKKKGCDC